MDNKGSNLLEPQSPNELQLSIEALSPSSKHSSAAKMCEEQKELYKDLDDIEILNSMENKQLDLIDMLPKIIEMQYTSLNQSFDSNNSESHQQESIRKLQGIIKSDLYHCSICNSKYSEKNKPKVLYCGDIICEVCAFKAIIGNTLTCLICGTIHTYEAHGPSNICVNGNISQISLTETFSEDQQKTLQVTPQQIIQHLPANLELLESMKGIEDFDILSQDSNDQQLNLSSISTNLASECQVFSITPVVQLRIDQEISKFVKEMHMQEMNDTFDTSQITQLKQDLKECMNDVIRERKQLSGVRLSRQTTPNSDEDALHQLSKLSDDESIILTNVKHLTRTSSSGSIGSEGKLFRISKAAEEYLKQKRKGELQDQLKQKMKQIVGNRAPRVDLFTQFSVYREKLDEDEQIIKQKATQVTDYNPDDYEGLTNLIKMQIPLGWAVDLPSIYEFPDEDFYYAYEMFGIGPYENKSIPATDQKRKESRMTESETFQGEVDKFIFCDLCKGKDINEEGLSESELEILRKERMVWYLRKGQNQIGVYWDYHVKRSLCIMCALKVRDSSPYAKLKMIDSKGKLRLMLMRNERLEEFFESKKQQMMRDALEGEMKKAIQVKQDEKKTRLHNETVKKIVDKLKNDPKYQKHLKNIKMIT